MKQRYVINGGRSEYISLWEDKDWVLLDVEGEPIIYKRSQLGEIVQHFTGQEIQDALRDFVNESYGSIDNNDDIDSFMDVLFS